MSDLDPSAVFVAFQSAWADESLTVLVPTGDRRAAVLFASKGTRVYGKKIAQFTNAPEFFITQDEYHKQFPVENPVMFVAVGENTQEGAAAPTEVLPALDASNSVVVTHVGDDTQDVEEPEAEPAKKGVTRRKKAKRNH